MAEVDVKKVASKPSPAASRKPASAGSRRRAPVPVKVAAANTPAAKPARAAAAKPLAAALAKPVPAPVSRPRGVTVTASKPARKPAAAASHPKPAATSMLMPLHEGIVYGPVRSRRLGRSLGINLTPAHLKLCSFNCSYCQYGWSEHSRRAAEPAFEHWPSAATVAKAVAAAVRALLAQGDRIDRLTLAGHGEPTMHPKFKEVVAALRKLRDELVPGVPIAVLSNASTLDRADVREALAEIDERYMKLDAGDLALGQWISPLHRAVDRRPEESA
jgi:sulfatase maturation enzyme AslB (radical SAM superfamily)